MAAVAKRDAVFLTLYLNTACLHCVGALHFLSLVQCLAMWQKKEPRELAVPYAVSVVQVSAGASISLRVWGVGFHAVSSASRWSTTHWQV